MGAKNKLVKHPPKKRETILRGHKRPRIKMKKIQNYLCVDVRTEMNDRDMQPGEKRMVEATLDVKNDGGFPNDNPEGHFTLREVPKKEHIEHPELRWHLLDRSKHGRVTMNSRHVKVEFYVHHDEYQSSSQLADMLASEIEILGENLSETDLQEEVSKCLC